MKRLEPSLHEGYFPRAAGVTEQLRARARSKQIWGPVLRTEGGTPQGLKGMARRSLAGTGILMLMSLSSEVGFCSA